MNDDEFLNEQFRKRLLARKKVLNKKEKLDEIYLCDYSDLYSPCFIEQRKNVIEELSKIELKLKRYS